MPKPAARWNYEGEQLTVDEIQARVPAFKREWIVAALHDGLTTLVQFHERDRRLTASKAAGRKKGGTTTFKKNLREYRQ